MNVPSAQYTKLLLTPSWLSTAANVVLSISIVGISAFLSRLTNNTLQQEVFAVHQVTANTSAGYQVITNNLANNVIISNLPLTLFWIGIGTIVYLFTVNLFGAFSRAVSLEQSLHYVHANRAGLIVQEVERVVVRVLSLIGGLLILRFYLRTALPYSLELTRSASKHWTIMSIASLAEALVILLVVFYVLTILLRLFLLRPRVFGTDYS